MLGPDGHKTIQRESCHLPRCPDFASTWRLIIKSCPTHDIELATKKTSHTVVKRKVIQDPTSPTFSNFKQQEFKKSTSKHQHPQLQSNKPFPKQFPQPDLFNRQLSVARVPDGFFPTSLSPRLERQNLAKTQIR